MASRVEFIKKIAEVQAKLKAPKNQRNNFGNYNYRSCEDILEAVKPLLTERNLVLTISDEVIPLGISDNSDVRFYIKTTTKITDGEFEISNSAFARESLDKKGMDDAQISGAASSYARKYALNGLFLIDDTKDADATNTHGKGNEDQRPLSEQKKDAVKPKEDKKADAQGSEAPTGKKTSSFKRPTANSGGI